jgi:hypothetical protein
LAAPSADGAARHQRTAKKRARGGRWRHVGVVAAATSVPLQHFECRPHRARTSAKRFAAPVRTGVRRRRRSAIGRNRDRGEYLMTWPAAGERPERSARVAETHRRDGATTTIQPYRSRSRPEVTSGWPLHQPIRDFIGFINSEVALPREPGGKGQPPTGAKGQPPTVISSWVWGHPRPDRATARRRVRRPRAASPCVARGPRIALSAVRSV